VVELTARIFVLLLYIFLQFSLKNWFLGVGTQKMSPLKKINPTGLSSFLILPLKKELIHNFLVLRHKKSNKHECFQCTNLEAGNK